MKKNWIIGPDHYSGIRKLKLNLKIVNEELNLTYNYRKQLLDSNMKKLE